MLDYVFTLTDKDRVFVMLLGSKKVIEVDGQSTFGLLILKDTGEKIHGSDFTKNFYTAKEAFTILSLDDKINCVING